MKWISGSWWNLLDLSFSQQSLWGTQGLLEGERLIKFMEHKTILLLKRSSLSEGFCLQLQLQGSKSSRLYRPLQFNKEGGFLWGPFWAPLGLQSTDLAVVLGSHIGNSLYNVDNFPDLICILDCLQAGSQTIMISFSVALLFTMLLTTEAMSLLSQHFAENILRLVWHVLTSSYFSFSSQAYKHMPWLWVHRWHWGLPTSSWRALRWWCPAEIPVSSLCFTVATEPLVKGVLQSGMYVSLVDNRS